MNKRDELKGLLDELPDASLETVESVVRYLIMQNVAEERFQSVSSTEMGTAGWSGVCNGVRVGGQTLRHIQDDALVEQTLHSFDGHLVQSSAQLSLSPDKATLRCVFTVSSGGQVFRHEHDFPANGANLLLNANE